MNDHIPSVVRPINPMGRILEGQTAIVTGASSGIGAGVARCLAEVGAAVAVNWVHGEDKAQAVVDSITGAGGRAFAVRADVSSEDDVARMFATVREEFGALDILINNAGLQQDAALDEMTLAEWNKVIGVNLTGQFLCAREAVRAFKQQGLRPEVSTSAGKIICISSVHEIIPWARHANYAASKGGVRMLMQSMAQEVAPLKIRVNSIAPGAIRTPINTEAWGTPEAYEDLMNLVPYKRIGEPEDVGRAVVWLVSDYSDYANGITMFIDGGMTCYPGFSAGG
jgi:glucose 1-dehydrogenase